MRHKGYNALKTYKIELSKVLFKIDSYRNIFSEYFSFVKYNSLAILFSSI